MRTAVHYHVVGLDRPLLRVVHQMQQQDAPAGDLDAVWRLVQLSHAGRRARLQSGMIAIVATEHADEGDLCFEHRFQRERRAIVARMQNHARSPVGELPHQLPDRQQVIMRVGEQPDQHQVVLHCGVAISRPARSSTVSRLVTMAKRSPSTITSAGRGREL